MFVRHRKHLLANLKNSHLLEFLISILESMFTRKSGTAYCPAVRNDYQYITTVENTIISRYTNTLLECFYRIHPSQSYS